MLTDANKKDKKEQKYSFFKKCPADAIVKKDYPIIIYKNYTIYDNNILFFIYFYQTIILNG